MPTLAICRGMQELNVALGGTLFARVHEVAGRMDHREPESDDLDERYGPRHPITLTAGGLLHELLGAGTVEVNSLHSQGIERPAPGLRVEAVASDGTVEAVSLPTAPAFVLGVQWHPEYKPLGNPVSMALFQAFGAAARRRAAGRQYVAGWQQAPAMPR